MTAYRFAMPSVRRSSSGSLALRLFSLPLILAMTASAQGQSAPEPAPTNDGARQRSSVNVAWVGLADQKPRSLLAEHRRLSAGLAALKPQRRGTVDAYVIVAGLDSDANFGREAREVGRVLSRRYDAAGRTIVMTADPAGDDVPASPANLALAIARVGELMDTREDVLVVYTTSHGSAPAGLAYRDTRRGGGTISPDRLAALLDDVGAPNRLLILSACYSGIFVPRLASDTSVVISAAAADRSSFGCSPGNDWTYFGDALVNRAMRKPQPLEAAFAEAGAAVAGWEATGKLKPSNPQVSIGKDVGRWLEPLEKRVPQQATAPVGRSPVEVIAAK